MNHGLVLNRLLATSILVCALFTAMGVRAQVDNNVSPVDGERDIRLLERWRLDDSADVMLGVILDAISDDDGNVYLVDEQLAQIVVITRAGEVDRILSRQGEGPGELTWPSDLMWLPERTIGVIDSRRGEITRLAPDGTPKDPFLLVDDEGNPLRSARIMQAANRGGTWAMRLHESVFAEGERRNVINLALVDDRGRIGKRLHGEARGWNFAKREYIEVREYLTGLGWWTLGPAGRVYLAPERNGYRIDVIGKSGEIERTITRPFAPRLRTRAEKERIGDSKSMNVGNDRVRLACEIEDHDPVIVDLHVTDNGDLWVRPTREQGERDDGEVLAYDLFDKRGVYRERVRFPGLKIRSQDRLIMLSPERFILITNADTSKAAVVEDDAVLEVILFEAR
ncbi:MAG: hypothetical protein GY835_01825 [bacterium]|nr:hypothetical protein [bacterium]